ncbi:MAG: 50S ribosomal protein L9 [Fimbriimonadaceae bacterium]|nr:50S ribosomal protein L9 [Fimbriimonadaceae bacterium]
MKVILKQTVPKVGKEGTVVNVADGFARNYLFPRGFAILADKKQIEALNKRNERLAVKLAGLKTDAEALKTRIDGSVIRIPGQVGAQQGKLYGAVTAQDVTDAIQKQLGVTLERKQVALVEPIRRLGDFAVELDLHREVDALITVTVFDPNAPVEAPKPAEPASDEA